MAHLDERTAFDIPTIQETGGQAISSINDGAVSLRMRSYTPASTVSTEPVAGQRITFLLQSSDYEQVLLNKCYLRLPLKVAASADARLTSLAPLAMFSSAVVRINGQICQSTDNVYEAACFNLRTKTNYPKIAESMFVASELIAVLAGNSVAFPESAIPSLASAETGSSF